MAEYIRREAVNNLIEDIRNNHFILMSDRITLVLLKSKVAELSAADVQPVKHGRWIKQEGFWNKNTVKCSLCGNYLDMNGVNGGRSDANFCPNCSARMDLKDGDTNG